MTNIVKNPIEPPSMDELPDEGPSVAAAKPDAQTIKVSAPKLEVLDEVHEDDDEGEKLSSKAHLVSPNEVQPLRLGGKHVVHLSGNNGRQAPVQQKLAFQ